MPLLLMVAGQLRPAIVNDKVRLGWQMNTVQQGQRRVQGCNPLHTSVDRQNAPVTLARSLGMKVRRYQKCQMLMKIISIV